MITILRVGDPHVKINNLEESAKLVDFIYQQAVENKVDRIEILGDLFHNHAIIRVEILTFWENFLEFISQSFQTVVLVGNHDQTGSYDSPMNALNIFKRINPGKLLIVDRPFLAGCFGYLPYIHDQQSFLEAANKLYDDGARVLVCHATFEGSKFDNGMYAPDGFDPEKLKFTNVISGHIHARQRFGKVIYPGTAKWDTNSDANEEKGLWLVTHDDENGAVLSEKFIDTSKVCSPIFCIEWKEGQEQPEIPPGRVTMELIGTSEWVKKQKEKLKGKCGVKSKITDKVNRVSRKVTNLSDFIGSFDPIAGITREQILDFLKEHQLV